MNIGVQPIYNVAVQVDFFDKAGQWVISSTWGTAFTPTVSMQRNPFEVDSGGGYSIGSYTTKIISWTREGPAEFLPLTVVYSDTTRYIDMLYVDAVFRNDNPVPLKNVIAYAWSLNQYLSYDASPLSNPIAPGETITYTQGIDYGMPPVYILGMGSADP